MPDAKMFGCRLKRLSVSFDDNSSGSGEIHRENSFVVENLADSDAVLKVRDSIQADFSKGVGVRFESDLEVRVQFDQPVAREDVQKFARKYVDEAALSISNLAFAFLVTQMGLSPVILPPVWEEDLARHHKTKMEKKGKAEEAVESGGR